MDEPIFALDIGTRTVIGIIAQGPPLTVTAACVHEHTERSMQDGQIHDVEKVARVVSEVKSDLEGQIGYELTKVAVAVAGRALKTSRTKVSIDMPFHEITKKDTSELEFEAIAKSRVGMEVDERFNCVGYSVVHYELDGQKFSNVIGQKGQSLSAEILVTFLPEVVINSMFLVLKKAGLEVTSITLEPIAALNVAIPPDMRKLNLALVDIGAGTSDIAVTDGGTVIGYGMVPEAGDEITDLICDHYLLDFNEGELIKRSLLSSDTVEMEDIFGVATTVPASEIISFIEKDVDNLAEHIANAILSINEKKPRAVVCVGGGSQTVLLRERLARHLDVPPQRVGTRLPEVMDTVADRTGNVSGAEMITPLGITLTAYQNLGMGFMDVEVNGNNVQIMDINGLTVMDALVAAKIKRIHHLPGLALSLTVNSKFMIIEGALGKHAEITLNGKDAHIDDTLHKGDKITFKPSVDGKDAHITVVGLSNRLGISSINVSVNGMPTVMHPVVLLNGTNVALEDDIPDRAEVTVRPVSLGDLIQCQDSSAAEDNIMVIVNNIAKYLDRTCRDIEVNGKHVDIDDVKNYALNEGDAVKIEKVDIDYTLQDVVEMPTEGKSVTVSLNDEKITFNGSKGTVMMNSKNAALSDIVNNEDIIIVENGRDANPIMSDIFEFMDLKREELVGKKIRMYLDDTHARFTTPLVDGSKINIEFVEV